MNYGLTIYGPLDEYGVERFHRRVHTVFPSTTHKQLKTAWQTLLDYPDFDNVDIAQRRSGDLVIHVYYSPVYVPEDADCVFHAKISPGGTYS